MHNVKYRKPKKGVHRLTRCETATVASWCCKDYEDILKKQLSSIIKLQMYMFHILSGTFLQVLQKCKKIYIS